MVDRQCSRCLRVGGSSECIVKDLVIAIVDDDNDKDREYKTPSNAVGVTLCQRESVLIGW